MTLNTNAGLKKIAMLAVVFFISLACTSFHGIIIQAASTTDWVPISCYTLRGRVTTYTNPACTQVSGYIDSMDLTKIMAFYANYGSVRVSYPTSRGTKQAYAKMSAFFEDDSFHTATGQTGKRLTAYRRSTGSSSIGTVFADDKCIAIGQANGRTQLIYPTSGNNYKMGWVNGAYDFNSPSYDTKYLGLGFHAAYYANTNPDLKAAYGYDQDKLLEHWLFFGLKEGRCASPVFDPKYYLQTNTDVANIIGWTNYEGAWMHFVEHGLEEGRASSIYYDGNCYQNENGDLYSLGFYGRAHHYIQYGAREGRRANFQMVDPSLLEGAVSPAANQETTKRSNVVNYMNSMATVEWTPSVDFRHWSYGQSGGNSMVWKAGTTYYGIPYSQKTRTTTLEKFQSCLSGNVYIGPSGQNTYLGSDCSSAVAMAYHTVNTGFNAASIATSVLYPAAGYTKAVGNYYNNNWRSSSTVIRNNSKESIQNSYAQLQPGDLLLTDYPSPHVMMVTEARSGCVKVTHQTTYKSSLHSTWRVNEQWGYDDLYSDKYIPVTMKGW